MNLREYYPEIQYKEFSINAEKTCLDLNYVFNMLCVPSQYTSGLPLERFPVVIKNSICFGVYKDKKQVGFARVIADQSEFASLWDVFIDEPYRRQGIGQVLLKYIFAHPLLRGTFRWFLMTEDAHGLYQKFGFKTATYNSYIMMKVNAD